MNKNNYINDCADDMLGKIVDCVKHEVKTQVAINSAIVDSVNSDGTVNLYFPPDSQSVFTKISNQTPFQLQSGDGVEVLLKNGSYNNCWIIAKHGATFK